MSSASEENSLVDSVLEKLLIIPRKYLRVGSFRTFAPAQPSHEEKLTCGEVTGLLALVRNIFTQEPLFLKLKSSSSSCCNDDDSSRKNPVEYFITGRFLGQFRELLRMFESIGGIHSIFYPGSHKKVIFLGDYGNRGGDGLEVCCLLFALKVKFPQNIYLLRGQHDCAPLTRMYGFYDEVKRKLNVKTWKKFADVFNVMPVQLLLIEEKVLCTPSGLSPMLNSLLDLELALCEIPDIFQLIDGSRQKSCCAKLFEGVHQYAKGVGFSSSDSCRYLPLDQNEENDREISANRSNYEQRCIRALLYGEDLNPNSSKTQKRIRDMKFLTNYYVQDDDEKLKAKEDSCNPIGNSAYAVASASSPRPNNVVNRPCEVGEDGVITDLLWAVPEHDRQGWGESHHGVSFTFGEDVFETFLKNSTCSLEDDIFDPKNSNENDASCREEKDAPSTHRNERRINLVLRMNFVDPDGFGTIRKCLDTFADGKLISFIGPSRYREMVENYGGVVKICRGMVGAEDGVAMENIVIRPRMDNYKRKTRTTFSF